MITVEEVAVPSFHTLLVAEPRADRRDPRSGVGPQLLDDAARRRGLDVVRASSDPRTGLDLLAPGVALRAPGGYLALLVQLGGDVRLAGATAAWFCGLDESVTGRRWHLVDPDRARALVARRPHLVKLADGKHPAFPARRFTSVAALDEALAAVGARPGTVLLATEGWMALHSEYRTFTRGRDPLTCSPYLVEDDPWTPQLRTHRASFHEQAAAFVQDLLASLPPDDVPPAAALDVARLDDGRFVLLEANQPWSAGLYGCDPDAVLDSVLAANESGADASSRWRWVPDTTVFDLRRWMSDRQPNG